MVSAKNPRLSVTTIESVRAAFHEVYATIHGQDEGSMPRFDDDQELKAQIIRKLLELASGGTLPADFKTKVLSSLPLR
jgi:hypothetical protein